MTTKTIKYKVMLADEGGIMIYEDGSRFIMADDEKASRMIGTDVYHMLEAQEITDAEVTITIEGEI